MTRPLHEAVQALCEKGRLDRALDTLSVFHTQPSTSTYLSLFAACSKSRALIPTRLLHVHLLLLDNVSLSPLLGQHLVVALAKCGAVDDALHVSRMSSSYRTVVSWTSIISALASSGRGFEALKVHQDMLDDGIQPDCYTFVSLFKACGDLFELARGRMLHADAYRYGFVKDAFVGSTLINMYGKCEAISEAENVFDSLAEHDVVTWNSMLSAYTEHGKRQKAVEFYIKMQESGVRQNERTFVSALQLCATFAENEEALVLNKGSCERMLPVQFGQMLHADAHMKGFTSDVFVGNCLVSIYGKCGAVAEAEYMFTSLTEHNGVSWNALLAAYVMQGKGLKALRLYSDMVSEGARPEELTFVSAIQACTIVAEKDEEIFFMGTSSRVIALRIGLALHADARQGGYTSSSPMVCNTLLRFYAQCGAVAEAEHLFGAMLQRNEVSWNAMLSAYIERGEEEKLLQLYTTMESEGLSPDEGGAALALQACGFLAEKEDTLSKDGRLNRMKSLDIGYTLHAEAYKKGSANSVFVHCTLVSMYGKCRAIVEAEYVFCAAPKHTVVSWNAMISAYMVQSQDFMALQLYRQMEAEGVTPDQLTYAAVILACATLVEKEHISHFEWQQSCTMSLEIGRALHAEVRHRCLESSRFVGSSLMSMYAKNRALAEVEHGFSIISYQDTVSWNVMLSAYAEGGMQRWALQLFAHMIKVGASSDEQTLVIALQACTGLLGEQVGQSMWGESARVVALEIARTLHAYASIEGFACNAIVGSALVSAYSKLGAKTEANVLFGKLPQRTVVTWTAMLSAHVEHGDGQEALKLYRQMQEDSVPPNHITIISILQASIKIGNLEICKQLHFDLVSAGYDRFLSVSATAILSYASYGSMVDVRALFDSLVDADMVLWNTCICGDGDDGDCKASLHMFEWLKCAGMQPDVLTLTSVLASCSHSGFVVEALEYLESASKNHNIFPDLRHYATMLDLFGRAGDLKRVTSLLEKMPMQADQGALSALLGACRAHGDVELAERVFNIMVELQPEQATAYMLMSNVYADAAMQEQAALAGNYDRVMGTETRSGLQRFMG